MKIKPEHIDYLHGKFVGYMQRNPDAVSAQRAALADYKGDLDQLMRWGMLRVAVGFEWVCENLYVYANDDHIDTALRHLQRELSI